MCLRAIPRKHGMVATALYLFTRLMPFGDYWSLNCTTPINQSISGRVRCTTGGLLACGSGRALSTRPTDDSWLSGEVGRQACLDLGRVEVLPAVPRLERGVARCQRQVPHRRRPMQCAPRAAKLAV